MLRLLITDSAGETRFETERDEILVGRREGVDLRLAEPAASRNHCLLRVERDHVRLMDLGTVNGTRVNGRRVDQARLVPGHELVIGTTRIRLLAFDPAGAPLAAAAPGAHRAAAGATAATAPAPPPTRTARTAPVSSGATPDFAREVREMLSKAPWYVISLVVHVVALLLLDLIPFRDREAPLAPGLEAVLPGSEALPEDVEQIEPDLAEIEPDLDEEPDLDLDDPAADRRQESPLDAIRAEREQERPDELGLGKGERIFRIEPLISKPLTGASEKLQKGDLEGEHGRAQEQVRNRMGDRIGDARRKLRASDILVVLGDFDKIELVLEAYGWPHTKIERQALVRRKYPAAKLLFINCARKPPAPEARKLVSIIKRFVQRGGWVVTSDWAIEPYLTDAFPDRVKLFEGKRRQPDTTVTVHPSSTDPLLEGVFSRRARSAWWLEETSKLFTVGGRVDVLVDSDDMLRRYGTKAVVFRFRYGRGLVLHLLGHFYQKDGNRMGLVGMHTLINNVILDRFG